MVMNFSLYHIERGRPVHTSLLLLDAMPVPVKSWPKLWRTQWFFITLTSTQRLWMTKYSGGMILSWAPFISTWINYASHGLIISSKEWMKGWNITWISGMLWPTPPSADHQEIANEMSTSLEVISRLLKKMEQKENWNCIAIKLKWSSNLLNQPIEFNRAKDL